ncbi:F-box/LRR-repeat protein 21-like [Physella acuta]|uniref:F-box/LRR-repeat protein 21-like n=1 Tax=Physella acuta TaxID=109671 RepID=UPI0027DD5157|nr:F-box/LRR-repeat protein 21-like [Physella acuta]
MAAVSSLLQSSQPRGSRFQKTEISLGMTKSAETDWSRLPYPALLLVFQQLDVIDRCHAYLTCRAWLHKLSPPSLWRSCHFTLHPTTADTSPQFPVILGESLRHLQVDCSDDSRTKVVYDLLESMLQAGNQRLVTVSLTSMRRLQPDFIHATPDLVKHLATLLANQRQLRVLDLTNADLTINQGVQLLAAARNTIHTLAIDNLFFTWFDYSLIKDIEDAIFRFTNLKDLEINYDCLRDSLLYGLAKTARNKLQTIKIVVSNNYTIEEVTTSAAWLNLTSACPHLKVVFVIELENDMCADDDLINALTPSMPLHALHFTAGTELTHLTEETFEYIGDTFKNSLRHVQIKYESYLPKRYIVELINSCSSLETVTVMERFQSSYVTINFKRLPRTSRACFRQTHTFTVTLDAEFKVVLEPQVTPPHTSWSVDRMKSYWTAAYNSWVGVYKWWTK